MPTRDVTLNFRVFADQARTVLEALQGGLKEFQADLEGTQQVSVETDSTLSRLGRSFRSVNAVIRQGATEAGIEAPLRRAREEMERVRGSAANYRSELQRIETRQTELAGESARLEAELSRLDVSFREQQATTRAAGTALGRYVTDIENSRRGAQRGSAEHDRLAAAVEREGAALRNVTETRRRARTALNDSNNEQRRLANTARQTAAALERQPAALERAEAAYRSVAADVDRTRAALAQLGQAVRGDLLRGFGEQRQRVAALQTEFNELSAATQQVGQRLSRLRSPTERQRAEFDSLRGSARAARDELIRQREIFASIRRELRGSGGFAQLGRSNQQAAASAEQLASRLQRVEALLRTGSRASAEYARATQAAANAQARQNTALPRTTRQLRSYASAARLASRSQSSLALATREFLGGSRQSLSFFQRLRGEIIGLAAAYGGLFAAFQGLQDVLEAGQRLDAVTNRLLVVFGGDTRLVAQELDFLRRTADRLGISFGALSDEYGKFAVATQNTNLQGERTRRIFLAVAEAARVQNLNQEAVSGTFVALTQIVSKGVLTMEELRRQLGDRLPGAIQIMADALDLSTAELIRLVETGDLSADVLADFADELTERFGPQLEGALEKTAASLGRFQNQIFQTLLRIGEGGALEGFIDLFNRLAEVLASPEFISFADDLGAGIARASRAVATLAENFRALIALLAFFLARRFAPFFLAMASSIRQVNTALALTGPRLDAVTARANRMGVAVSRSTVALHRFGRALRVIGLQTGIGVILGVVGAGLAALATRAERSTEALVEHGKILDTVRNALDKYGDSVKDVRRELEDLSVAQLQVNRQQVQEAIERSLSGLTADLDLEVRLRSGTRDQSFLVVAGALGQIRDLFREGRIDAQQYADATDNLAEHYRDVVPAVDGVVAAEQRRVARVQELQQADREAALILQAKTGTTEEAAEANRQLGSTLESVVNEAEKAAMATAAYEQALAKFQGAVPQLASQLREIEQQNAFEALRAELISAARAAGVTEETINGIVTAAERLNQVNRTIEGASGGVGIAAQLLTEGEGVTEDFANRLLDAAERVQAEFGDTIFGALPQEAQAAFIAMTAQLGDVAEDWKQIAADAIDEGTLDGVAEAIQNTQGLGNVGTVLYRKILAEFVRAGVIDQQRFIELIQREREETRKTAEEKKEADEAEAERLRERIAQQQQATRDTIAGLQFENSLELLRINGQERLAAQVAAIASARRQNINLTSQEAATIAEAAGRQFDLTNFVDEETAARERASEAEQRVNDLLGLRSQLQQELNQLIEQGLDPQRQADLAVQIAQVNDLLRMSADEALLLAEALNASDPEVLALISRLRELLDSIDATTTGATKFQQAFERSFSGAAVSAFDQFVDDLAEGRNAIASLGQAFRRFAADFLRQIARMIVQQLALNAARRIFNSLLGGGGGGGIGGFLGSLFGFQQPGLVGRRGHPIRIPSVGTAGFGRGGAFLAVVHRGEEIVGRSNPRNIANGGVGDLNLNVIDAVGADVSASAQVDRQGNVDLTVQLDELLADLAISGGQFSAALAGLGAIPPIEGR